MAKQNAQNAQNGPTPAGLSELWRRIGFVLFAIFIFRVSSHIPIPGIDGEQLARLFDQNKGTFLSLFNMFSGGSLSRMSITAMGIMPYISASIVMQLMTAVTPQLEQLKKEGESGRRKITQYTRYLALAICVIQGFAYSSTLTSSGIAQDTWQFYFVAIITLATGTMFLMWLGEQITEYGIGNGISIIIFSGIVAGIPTAIGQTLEASRQGELQAFLIPLIILVVVTVIWAIVFVEKGQRRITVNYAKRQQGRKVFAAQTSHLPLKVNTAGVIPPIFASSILLLPASMGTWFGQNEGMAWMQDIALAVSPGQPLYMLLFAMGIIFFCYFYTAITMNPKDIAENLKKSGAFIPGIRPGDQSAKYIDKVLNRLTLVGGIYITAVCLIPELFVIASGTPFYFGGTSILIIVGVVMDFMSQVQSHLMSSQYESMMKKANLKGRGPAGSLR